ncbi:hypothetical protein GOV14_06530 [Candidatus Pacearchaeota archaeon]|nr:hypothetical protein [Candidatus Pacearchaeota archaeon]
MKRLKMRHKFQDDIDEAIRHLQIADHMTYVTFPIVNENRLLLKIFEETHKSIIYCINAILNYEFLYKRIKLYKTREDNLNTFLTKCAKNYQLSNEQIKKIKKIIQISKSRKESAMEFVRQEKIVIMSNNLQTQTLNLIQIKEYLLLAKEILMKINTKMNK